MRGFVAMFSVTNRNASSNRGRLGSILLRDSSHSDPSISVRHFFTAAQSYLGGRTTVTSRIALLAPALVRLLPAVLDPLTQMPTHMECPRGHRGSSSPPSEDASNPQT